MCTFCKLEWTGTVYGSVTELNLEHLKNENGLWVPPSKRGKVLYKM